MFKTDYTTKKQVMGYTIQETKNLASETCPPVLH